VDATRPEPPEDRGAGSRVAAVRARAETLAREGAERVQEARRRSPLVARAFDVVDRDAERFGGLFAGALAYRLFLWLVPFALLLVGLLGAVTEADDGASASVAEDFGLHGALADSLREGASQRGWWVAIIIGLFGMLWAGVSASKALRLSHAAAWGLPRGRPGSPVRGTLGFAAGVLALLGATLVAARLREVQGALGLVASLLVLVIFVAVWMAVSSHLPHRPGPRGQLLPGAILFGVGLECVHLFTAYYLVDRAARAQSTYGAIGTALVVLLWLYVVSRLIVASAVLNAELARHTRARRDAAGEEPEWNPDA
jgi:uncharacterized BrkB/YihY/UPF0761 family membrane protein